MKVLINVKSLCWLVPSYYPDISQHIKPVQKLISRSELAGFYVYFNSTLWFSGITPAISWSAVCSKCRCIKGKGSENPVKESVCWENPSPNLKCCVPFSLIPTCLATLCLLGNWAWYANSAFLKSLCPYTLHWCSTKFLVFRILCVKLPPSLIFDLLWIQDPTPLVLVKYTIV